MISHLLQYRGRISAIFTRIQCYSFLYSMLVLDARKMALPTPSKHGTCIGDISLGKLTPNTPPPIFWQKEQARDLKNRKQLQHLRLARRLFLLVLWIFAR